MALRMLIAATLLCLAGSFLSGCIPAEAPQEAAPAPATAPVKAPATPAPTPAPVAPAPVPAAAEPAAMEPATVEPNVVAPVIADPAPVTSVEEPAAAIEPEPNEVDYIAPEETIVLPGMEPTAEGRSRLLVSGAAPGQGNVSIGVGPVENSPTPALLVDGTLPDGHVTGTITKPSAGAQDWNLDLKFSFTKPGYEILSILPSTMSGQPIAAGGVPPETVLLQVTLRMPVTDPNAPAVLEEQHFTLTVPAPDETTFFFNVLSSN